MNPVVLKILVQSRANPLCLAAELVVSFLDSTPRRSRLRQLPGPPPRNASSIEFFSAHVAAAPSGSLYFRVCDV